jgi:hypothetical protein
MWLSVLKLLLKCDVVSLYSVVKQQSKCNTGKVCNCLITFLLTVVLSIEEHVFLVEYVFRKGNRNSNVVQEQFADEFPETPVPHHNAFHRLIGKFRETGSVLDTEQSGRLSKLSNKKLMLIVNKIKQVQACMDVRGHHFQHLL